MMTTQELIENAMLYAFGLLDDADSSRYEDAMLRAEPAVRARVLEETRRMSDLGELLPSDEPHPEMREMVLAAVRAAMREQENEQRLTASPVAGRITHESAARDSSKRAQPRVSTSPKVHRSWRAATIGFAAATIALTVVSMNHYQTYQSTVPDRNLAALYDAIGPEFLDDTIFNENTTRVAMVSPDASANSVAAVWHNPDWSSARLFVKNLRNEQDAPYKLVVLDENGEVVREVASFTSQGEFENLEVRVNLDAEKRLAIYQDVVEAESSDAPLLMSVDSSL